MNPYEKILKEIASGMLDDFDGVKPNFSNDAFIDSLLIFQTALMDKLFDNQDYDKMDFDDRRKMAQAGGDDLRKFIHTFTGLDTHQLVENYGK